MGEICKMKIVIDTNIIFSTLLNSNSNIGDLIFNSGKLFEFYSCNYMRYERRKDWERIKKNKSGFHLN